MTVETGRLNLGVLRMVQQRIFARPAQPRQPIADSMAKAQFKTLNSNGNKENKLLVLSIIIGQQPIYSARWKPDIIKAVTKLSTDIDTTIQEKAQAALAILTKDAETAPEGLTEPAAVEQARQTLQAIVDRNTYPEELVNEYPTKAEALKMLGDLALRPELKALADQVIVLILAKRDAERSVFEAHQQAQARFAEAAAALGTAAAALQEKRVGLETELSAIVININELSAQTEMLTKWLTLVDAEIETVSAPATAQLGALETARTTLTEYFRTIERINGDSRSRIAEIRGEIAQLDEFDATVNDKMLEISKIQEARLVSLGEAEAACIKALELLTLGDQLNIAEAIKTKESVGTLTRLIEETTTALGRKINEEAVMLTPTVEEPAEAILGYAKAQLEAKIGLIRAELEQKQLAAKATTEALAAIVESSKHALAQIHTVLAALTLEPINVGGGPVKEYKTPIELGISLRPARPEPEAPPPPQFAAHIIEFIKVEDVARQILELIANDTILRLPGQADEQIAEAAVKTAAIINLIEATHAANLAAEIALAREMLAIQAPA